jgi:hypothetical protein
MFFNRVFTLRGTRRGPELQATIDQQTASLKLYQYEACPRIPRGGSSKPLIFMDSDTSDRRLRGNDDLGKYRRFRMRTS